MTQPPKFIGPHDLGGQTDGPLAGEIDRSEHEYAHWERLVDAIIYVLRDKGVMTDSAQLREGIESLGDDAYDRLTYYERWAASTAKTCIEKGVITQAELDAKVTAMMAEKGLS